MCVVFSECTYIIQVSLMMRPVPRWKHIQHYTCVVTDSSSCCFCTNRFTQEILVGVVRVIAMLVRCGSKK